MNFTFKTEKPTGKWRSFNPETHHIKLNKIEVGTINGQGRFNDSPPFKIRLQVKKKDINEDGNPNCRWKWIILKKDSQTLQEAKDFLNQHFKEITELYEIWMGK